MKKILLSVLAILTFISTATIQTNAKEDNSQISTYKDVKEWRYKIMNGRLYKRLFNYSKNRWETDWILVQS